MPEVASVKVKWNNSAIKKIDNNAMKCLFHLGFDIASQARKNAPYVTGALRETIRAEDVGKNEIDVIAGGIYNRREVRYAWRREQGPNRNSATEHYMENAKNTIMTGNWEKKYFGDIT